MHPRPWGLIPLLTMLLLVEACLPSDESNGVRESSSAADGAPVAPVSLAVDGVGQLAFPVSSDEVAARFGVPMPPPPGDAGEVWCTMTWLPVAPGDSILSMFTDRGLVRMDVLDRGRRTAAGVGVGSTEEAIREAYGTAVEATPHKYTDGKYLTVPGPSGDRALVFESDGAGAVTTYRVGALPEVAWIEGCS